MCGIVGAIATRPIEPQTLVAMRDLLAHRGPDHAGLWMSGDRCVALGHRRLAILDLRPEANQPFISHDGRYAITFNGEIYNYKELREELRACGVDFRTQSDTEVLVEAYRFWGEACLERLSGMFAFAIWDARERKLFCARDRAGEKPFYYAALGDAFLFASELKAIVRWPGFVKQLNYPALVDFLTFGFVPDPKAIWENCFKLPPGHCMYVRADGTIAGPPRAYWDLQFDPDYSVSDWNPAILETIQKAAKEMTVADVPVGAFLSGGVDSSSVTAALAKAGCKVRTFTIGFDDQAFDERKWARLVASRFGTSHTEKIVVPSEIAADFEKLIWHYDEPFNDFSYLPSYYVCREARQFITVALSGDGGDEIFAGYAKYRRLSVRQKLEDRIPRALRKLAFSGADFVLSEASQVRQITGPYAQSAPELLLDMLTTCFPLPVLRSSSRGALAQTLKEYSPLDVLKPLLSKAPPAEIGFVNAMRYLDLKLTLAGDMLVKVDRASMAVSLEVRPVYLHRELMELAARIPPAELADSKHAKKALKSALRAWLPDSVLYRPKMGFGVPLKSWMKQELSGFFGAASGHGEIEELFDSKSAGAAMAGASDSRLASTAHSVSLLGAWMAKWSDGIEQDSPLVHQATNISAT
jgi:asparagine synthase (glutamine-hydrolysing)